MREPFFHKAELINLERQLTGNYCEDKKTTRLTLDALFNERINEIGGYPIFRSPFSGSVSKAFLSIAANFIRFNEKDVFIITGNRLQTLFIKHSFESVNLNCPIMEEKPFGHKCRTEIGFCDKIYDSIKHFLVYSAEDIPNFICHELFFNHQSFWQFVDTSQALPISKEGKWVYPNQKDNNYDEYNVGIWGNENITRFTTYLYSSNLPTECIKNGHNGEMPLLLKNDKQFEWITEKIQTIQSNSIAVLFQRDIDVKMAFHSFLKKGITVEVKYSIGREMIDNIDFKTDVPKLLTYYNSKGLLFDTVIMPINSHCNNKLSKRLVTIATSTACNNLYVIYDEMPELFKNIPSSLYCEHS